MRDECAFTSCLAMSVLCFAGEKNEFFFRGIGRIFFCEMNALKCCQAISVVVIHSYLFVVVLSGDRVDFFWCEMNALTCSPAISVVVVAFVLGICFGGYGGLFWGLRDECALIFSDNFGCCISLIFVADFVIFFFSLGDREDFICCEMNALTCSLTISVVVIGGGCVVVVFFGSISPPWPLRVMNAPSSSTAISVVVFC